MTDDRPADRPRRRPAAARLTRAEWSLLLILVAIQFTHMVDFVIIMPLGDRLRKELKITKEEFGAVVAAYALAAGVASLLASSVMDRFDRKSVLLTMYAGFGLSTLFCGLATTYELLLVSRTLAGAFGGLAAVALMAVIGDVFPPEKRGRASGAVVSSFAAASILGLPVGLYLTPIYGRGMPFIVLAVVSAVVWIVAVFLLPPVRGHLAAPRRHPVAEFAAVVRQPNHLWGFAFTFFLVLGTFTVASFLAPVYSSVNGWDEHQLAVVYMVGGAFTLLGTNLIGRMADRVPRLGLFRVLGGGAIVMALIVTCFPAVPLWAAALGLSGFMVFAAGRMVPAQAMLLGVSGPATRGAFMSLNTAVQHLATGLAPMIAGVILVETPDKKLEHFWAVGLFAAATAGVSLVLAGRLKAVSQAMPAVVVPAVPPEQGLATTVAEPVGAA